MTPQPLSVAQPESTAASAPARPRSNRIFGSGEMAQRIRDFDWASTSVGPIESWPDALLITVNTMLASRHPKFLWWGHDLVQFYNDGYRPSLGNDKHPRALGQRGPECWPEIWPTIGPQIEAVMSRGESNWHEDQLIPINRNGTLEDVYWTYGYSPVRDSHGDIRGTLVVCLETTATVRLRLQLQQERERLAAIFQQAPAFFALLSGPDHVFEMTNPLYQKLIGHRDVLGKPIRQVIPEATEQGFVEILDKVYATGEPFVGSRLPLHLVRTIGQPLELFYLDFVYQPRREPDGTISGIIALGIDVTESKRTEQLLVQTEKLAAVGRLASSIAHEINNPLEAITNLLYLARDTAINPRTQEYLDTADLELRRVSVIANQTLRFYRQSTDPRPISSHDLIDATLPLYHGRLLNSTVTVERRERSTRPITCFDGEIRQVLSNLIGNAVDAMTPHGGRLLIRSHNATHPTTGERGVSITIADTGIGMSPYTLTRIAEPFFTTKGIGGTGLGLWISREIIHRHRGTLHIRSSQHLSHPGSIFSLFLPTAGPTTESLKTS